MNIYSEIIKKIGTQETAENINEAVDILCNDMYRLNKVDDKLISKLPQDDALHEAMNELELVKTEKTEWLLGLKKAIKEMRILILDVAVRLDLKTREDVIEWIKRNVGEDVVTRFQTNPEILAGAKIIFEGRYYEKKV